MKVNAVGGTDGRTSKRVTVVADAEPADQRCVARKKVRRAGRVR